MPRLLYHVHTTADSIRWILSLVYIIALVGAASGRRDEPGSRGKQGSQMKNADDSVRTMPPAAARASRASRQ